MSLQKTFQFAFDRKISKQFKNKGGAKKSETVEDKRHSYSTLSFKSRHFQQSHVSGKICLFSNASVVSTQKRLLATKKF